MSQSGIELDSQICHKLYVASNAMTRLYRPVLKEMGLTYPQYIIMLALWDRALTLEDEAASQGLMSATELNSITQIDVGALSLMLTKLSQKKLISVKKDKDDKRRKMIRLSAKGKNLRNKALKVPEKMICHFSSMQMEDFLQLQSLMRKLIGDTSKALES